MGNIVDFSDYSDDGLEKTVDTLLEQTTDVQQLLEQLGNLSETQKRKILAILRDRMQTKLQSFDADELPFNELDSELMRAAHRERHRKKQEGEEDLKKERRNKLLKRLRKIFAVHSADEVLGQTKQTAQHKQGAGKQHQQQGTPAHPILSKDNNQFFGREDDMNPVPTDAAIEEYNEKAPVNAPRYTHTAQPGFQPSAAPTPSPLK